MSVKSPSTPLLKKGGGCLGLFKIRGIAIPTFLKQSQQFAPFFNKGAGALFSPLF
jgi:hypothetical protein